MYELVRVGHDNLIGEIIRLEGDSATIQGINLLRLICSTQYNASEMRNMSIVLITIQLVNNFQFRVHVKLLCE